ncbi:MAG: DUF2924 domain-containing protein [Afipia sp.]|jgi:hypothetical protein
MARLQNSEVASNSSLNRLEQRSHRVLKNSRARHLPKHLQTAVESYRRQADQSEDVDRAIHQFLKQITEKDTRTTVMAKLVAFDRAQVEMKAGTILTREWNGATHLVIVVDGGFLWEGNRYDSLSKIAVAITGTRWNGPRFFGLRDASTKADKP